MLTTLLSGDLPRSRVLAALLLLLGLLLLLAPFLFPGARALDTAARVAIFAALVASYDLLLGYAGIVSFAHTMFFGIGAYGNGIALVRLGRGWEAVLAGTAAGIALAALLALLIGLASLRVRAIFFAMITLAVASAFAVLASQLPGLTGGEDGLNVPVPRELTPAFRLVEGKVLGAQINGRFLAYYLVLFGALAVLLLLLRIVNSPFGRVLQAIRENDFRAEAIGYRVVLYRTAATVLSAALAAFAGSLWVLWLRYVGPSTTLSLEIMIDILLMVVIGGMGTIWGAALGAAVFVVAQSYLQDLMRAGAEATSGLPLLPQLLDPDRWLLWLGLLFVLSVYFFPEGIVGRLRAGAMRRDT